MRQRQETTFSKMETRLSSVLIENTLHDKDCDIAVFDIDGDIL